VEKFNFWLFSAIGFLYLCMDEYFMAHEGMDEWIGLLFKKNIKYLTESTALSELSAWKI